MKTTRIVSYIERRTGRAPYIRLSGKQLEAIGLKVGALFTIHFDESALTLKAQAGAGKGEA